VAAGCAWCHSRTRTHACLLVVSCSCLCVVFCLGGLFRVTPHCISSILLSGYCISGCCVCGGVEVWGRGVHRCRRLGLGRGVVFFAVRFFFRPPSVSATLPPPPETRKQQQGSFFYRAIARGISFMAAVRVWDIIY